MYFNVFSVLLAVGIKEFLRVRGRLWRRPDGIKWKNWWQWWLFLVTEREYSPGSGLWAVPEILLVRLAMRLSLALCLTVSGIVPG